MTATLCLNMIVRDEMAHLERCLTSVADHIGCWMIGDTGSTDGTQAFIRAFFAQRGLPGELHELSVTNGGQARNAALDRALQSDLAFDYLLFAEANMELMVQATDFRRLLEAPCYALAQRCDVTQWNARLLHRHAGGRYRGVIHEYLDVPHGSQKLHGVWFRDHDVKVVDSQGEIRALWNALRGEPDNGRYMFHLGRALQAAGETALAGKIHSKRAQAGGDEEEAWCARLLEARCLLAQHDDAGFVASALAAFNQRPWRAEPMYDLARFYRERNMNEVGALFAATGMALAPPEGDCRFIEDRIYATGLREEFSITAVGSSDPALKARGHAICEWLALHREVPVEVHDLARTTLMSYSLPARDLMPSFSAERMRLLQPGDWTAINPSVARQNGQIVMVLRCTNFVVTESGEPKTHDGSPPTTRNLLLHLDAGLQVVWGGEIVAPADLPNPASGFEEMRPFTWDGALWCLATVRHLTVEGGCEQVLARIDSSPDGLSRLVDWRVLRPDGPCADETNWMPFGAGGAPLFIRSNEPTVVVDSQARPVGQATPAVAAETFRGGTQAIQFDGGWLALIHEVGERDTGRCHWHRFVWYDSLMVLRAVSQRFFFHRRGIEVAAGLAWHPFGAHLLISFGVGNAEAWIASVEAVHVAAILAGPAELLVRGSAPVARVTRPEPAGGGQPAVSNVPIAEAAQ